ncbi:hypothetical protein CKO32_04320 [Afifella marina DSM 2698]|nr:hypothetical protein [Afifella marina DSM 2698]MBK1625782.1 hypothetical protein [Afifella marina]MBK5917605.1 hypothetical protein [Afifella marina]RAI23532.1 hypothetical protein CH311_01235 [Afifella marina DSM 2698]
MPVKRQALKASETQIPRELFRLSFFRHSSAVAHGLRQRLFIAAALSYKPPHASRDHSPSAN